MKRHVDTFRKVSALPVLLLLASVATSCVKPKLHRPQNIERHDGFSMAFIEFDDHGEPWAPSQLERTIDLIEDANREYSQVGVILFVHGWHNDASKREDRKKDNNVEGFTGLLDVAVEALRNEGTLDEDSHLIGVYLGWRGRSTNNKLVKPLTFYSRRGAGQRVAGVSTTEAIMRVMAAAKTNPRSSGIVLGHSFGGMIVERALAQNLVGYAATRDEEFTPLADLVVLVNAASQSMTAKSMLSILERNRLKLYREAADGSRRETPLVVSVTSTGDTATGNLYPTALGIKGVTKRFRKYEPTDCGPPSAQKSFYKQTAGHNTTLHSHVISVEPTENYEPDFSKPMTLEEAIDQETGQTKYIFNGKENRFAIERLGFSFNDTPYWIMNVPPELIAGHSDIFKFDTVQMLRALLRMSGAMEGDERGILVRETGVRPLALVPLPEGGIGYLGRSRRFYLVDRNDDKPLAVSCLPPLIDPASIVGGFFEGSRVHVVVSGQKKSEKKVEYETGMLSFDFRLVGSEGQVWSQIKSDLDFTAATGETASKTLYLARKGQLYSVDVTDKKKLEPELLLEFDRPEHVSELQIGPAGRHIYMIDREENALFVIDLDSEHPAPGLIAKDLGLIADVVVTGDRTLLVLDSVGKRVLEIDCSETDECSSPTLFASAAGFKLPHDLIVDVDGDVWVGDLEAQSIFVFDSEGNAVGVLDSVDGFAR